MLVGELRKYLADFKEDQEVVVEQMPGYKIGVKPLPEEVKPVEAEVVEDKKPE